MKAMATAGEIKNLKDFWGFIRCELKPKGRIFTAFNVISLPIILLGAVLIIIRLVKGLGSVTNLSQEFPWGIWIGFDVMVGVAFAGGAYILTFVVYISSRCQGNRPQWFPCLCFLCRRNLAGPRSLVEHRQPHPGE